MPRTRDGDDELDLEALQRWTQANLRARYAYTRPRLRRPRPTPKNERQPIAKTPLRNENNPKP